MESWTTKSEEDLTLLIKDWLKAQNRTQADLGKSLQSSSSRMPALIEVLKNKYHQGGMPYVIASLCKVEKEWSNKNIDSTESNLIEDPFSQLDLILKDLKNKSTNNGE